MTLAEVAYAPARVAVHDGAGRYLADLQAPAGKRAYRTMAVAQAQYVVDEEDPALAYCDPTEGCLLVVESELLPLWAGPLVTLSGGPVQGTMTLEARSYEAVLQRRYLPTGFLASGSSGAVFRDAWRAVEAENSANVVLAPDLAPGEPFAGGAYGDLDLFRVWTQLATQTAHTWWLEHRLVAGMLETTAHFRSERGQDRTAQVTLTVGPYASVRVNAWRITQDESPHRLRAVGGAASTTQAFSERPRLERRASASAPVSTASLVTRESTRHGYDFARWPTGDTPLTRAEQLAILDNVRGSGELAIAAEAILRQGRMAQRAVDLEVQGYAELWPYCMPGDVIRLQLPAPYFLRGYSDVASILAVEGVEELGTMRLDLEVRSAA